MNDVIQKNAINFSNRVVKKIRSKREKKIPTEDKAKNDLTKFISIARQYQQEEEKEGRYCFLDVEQLT